MSISGSTREQATEWVTRRHSGAWQQTDEVQLQTWLAASADNRTAYALANRTWGVLGQVSLRPQQSAPRRFATRHWVGACVAAAVAALAFPLWQYASMWWAGPTLHWIAPIGKPRQLTLADGSQVTLDAGSELVAQVGAHLRRVSLVRGEAVFEVQHDSSRPFEVSVGHGQIADLGTSFDVEVLTDSVRVSVFSGRVGLRTSQGEVQLGAGQSGGFDNQESLLPISVDKDSTPWSPGVRRFDAAPLGDIVQRFERYQAVTFVFADPQLARLRISGTFRFTDVPTFLQTLSAAFPVDSRWLAPDRVELVPRGT